MARQKTIIMTGYYRVSTKKEAQETSFKNQPAYFKTLLELPEYKHYKAYKKFYFDWGLSGTKLNRPGFKELLEDAGLKIEIKVNDEVPHPNFPDRYIKQHTYITSVDPTKKPKFEEIWIKSTSRFARNINAYDILVTLRRAGVYVYFIDLDISTRNKDNLGTIRKRLDEDMSYSEGLSRNRKIVQIQYEKENRVVGDTYGYIYHKKTKSNLPYYTVDPVASKVVQKVFQYCIEGLGVRRTSAKLAEEGYLAPKSNKPFSDSTISHILVQEKYMGLNTSGKFTTGSLFEKLNTATVRKDYLDRLRPSKDLPAIITPEVFYAAQEARKIRVTRTPTMRTCGLKTPSHPFKDLLVCGMCGSHFIYDNDGGKHPHFRCATKVSQSVSACSVNNVPLDKLNSYMEKLGQEEMFTLIETDFENTIISLITLIENYLNRLKKPESHTSKEIIELQERLENVNNAKDLIFRHMTSKPLTATLEESYLRRLSEYDEELISITTTLENIQNPITDSKEILKNLFRVVEEQFKIIDSKKKVYTQEELLTLLSKIKVYGSLKANKGGRIISLILLPILKTTELSQGLLDVGYTEFSYKMRNHLLDYEVPSEGYLHDVDNDNLSVAERDSAHTRVTKSKWEKSSSKYILNNSSFYNADGSVGYIHTLGLEGTSIVQQLKERVLKLKQEFQQLF